MGIALQRLGEVLARYLTQARPELRAPIVAGGADWHTHLRPCDVVLVDGSSKISAAIRYLTQSTWTHSALYVGDAPGLSLDGVHAPLVEADMRAGVRAVPLAKYDHYNIRICRPAQLAAHDAERVLRFAVDAIGRQYDLRNVFDLARYLLPEPPVPMRFRRRMIELGSGEPTRAICSTLIAQAFQSVGYPIIPQLQQATTGVVYQPRHHSFITPRDFDLSPYFAVIKPSLESGFDYRNFPWARQPPGA